MTGICFAPTLPLSLQAISAKVAVSAISPCLAGHALSFFSNWLTRSTPAITVPAPLTTPRLRHDPLCTRNPIQRAIQNT